jgi:hypothetical protein
MRYLARKTMIEDTGSGFERDLPAFGSDFSPTIQQVNRSGKAHIE